VLDHALGNAAPIGGIKLAAAAGWFAARPSGTEDLYKIHAESFPGPGHLQQLLQDAQRIVDAALKADHSEAGQGGERA
jgi:phosphoglucomutase